MKNHYYLFSLLALLLTLASPAISRAEELNAGANIQVDASAQTQDNRSSGSIRSNISVQGRPPLAPKPSIGIMRDRILNDSQMENMRNNQDYRNNLLERNTATTTRTRDLRGMPPQNSGNEQDSENSRINQGRRFASTTMMASTSLMMRFDRDGYDQDHKAMMANMFRLRKANVTKQLHTALSNLTLIRTRINSRIEKEKTAGKDMTAAISLLATADLDLKTAGDAVIALDAYMPPASASATTTATTSESIDLNTARSLAKAAQGDIRDAQKSLSEVVRAIAHEMGIDIEVREGTSTESTTTQE